MQRRMGLWTGIFEEWMEKEGIPIYEGETDVAEADRLHKELMKYVLDQAWVIPQVVAPTYTLWWPWVKNYSGEANVGYNDRCFARWVWYDQELKKSIGY